MNEVFTLLPGISERAMAQMSDQVLAVGTEFGFLSEQTVPALYQALSAGVPPDNVFSFMEQAAKTAIGGATDLATAVDVLTTATNAWGVENLSAQQASDYLFTTVRLGKTTMDELGASLFQVAPVAASLGVGLDQVGASMVALTLQGVPTAQAATSLRQAFVELQDSGSQAAQAFQEVSGQSFPEFIAAGGTVGEAMGLLEDHAASLGLGVNELFGSVEAGNAALLLTSETGAEAFRNAMVEMATSAGATDEAFQTMKEGLGFAWDQIKAKVEEALIRIGAVLAPFVLQAVEWLSERLPGAIEVLIGWFSAMADWWTDNDIGGLIAGIWENVVIPALQAVGAFIGEVLIPAFVGIINWWSDNDVGGKIAAVLGIAASFITETLIPAFVTILEWWEDNAQPIIDTVGEVIGGITEFFEDLKTLVSDSLAEITGFWESHGELIRAIVAEDGEEIVRIIKETWLDVAEANLAEHGISMTGLLEGNLEDWRKVFEANLPLLVAYISGEWEELRGYLSEIWDEIQVAWSDFWDDKRRLTDENTALLSAQLEAFGANLAERWTQIREFASLAWQGMLLAAEIIWGQIRAAIENRIIELQTSAATLWEQIKATALQKWNELVAGVQAVFGPFSGAWSAFWSQVSAIASTLWTAIKANVSSLWAQTQAAVSAAYGPFQGAWSAFWSTVSGIASSIWTAIKANVSTLWSQTQAAITSAYGALQSGWSGLWNNFLGAVSSAWAQIKGVVGGAVDFLIGKIRALINAINSIPGLPNISVPSVPSPGKAFSPKPAPSGGFTPLQHGGEVFRSGLALLGERGPELAFMPAGARVLPAEMTEALGGGGHLPPIVVQLVLDGEVLAEELVDPVRRRLIRSGQRNVTVGLS